MMIDSHCHLYFEDFQKMEGGLEAVLRRAQEKGVQLMLNVSTDLTIAPKVIALAEKYPFIYASVGVHPCHVAQKGVPDCQDLIDLAKHPKVIALGETGLDYYHNTTAKALQWESLMNHAYCAKMLQLPLIIHTREADTDMMRFLREQNGCQGVLHCFTSSKALAQAALSVGFYISASGIITFQKTDELHAIFKDIPLERLLIETDAPYLAPHPHRGKANEPAYVHFVAEKLAEIKNISFETITNITTQNFCRLFQVSLEESKT